MRYQQNLKFAFPVLLFLLSLASTAQDQPPKKEVEQVNGLLAIQVGIPSQQMKQAVTNNMGNLGFGLGLSVLSNPFSWGRNKRNSPLRIGAEAGYTYYGRFLSEVNYGGYTGSYKTSYGIVQLNALLQLRPAEPDIITPFIEVLAGGNFYLSSIKDNLSAIETGLGIQSADLGGLASATFNKGLAVGCMFGKKKANDNPRFSVRLSYNVGGNIKYVIRNSLDYNPSNGQLEYYVGKAPVKYFMAQVGIGF